MPETGNHYLYDGSDLADPDTWAEDWEPDYPDALNDRCPRCKGTGLDRWEEDDCPECFGEGSIANLAPIVKRIH